MSNHVIRQILSPAKIFPSKTTKAADLRSLVHSMRVTPIDSELIRVGPNKDGGYLVPDCISDIKYCFSPGVAESSDFELSLANRDMEIFLADRSVDAPPITHPNFHFQKKFIASRDCTSEGLMTMDSWYSEMIEPPTNNSPEAILQMDIEGQEYEVLHNMSGSLLSRFRVIIIEFHRLYELADRYSYRWMSSAFHKLLQSHTVVHIHPNNNRKTLSLHGIKIPANMEFTLLRRDHLKTADKTLTFPHPLDQKCVASKPDIILPACWHA